MPGTDATNNLKTTFGVKKGASKATSTIQIRRPIDTRDKNDYVIPLDTKFPMAWAINSSSNDFTKYHNLQGAMSGYIKTAAGGVDQTAITPVADVKKEGAMSLIGLFGVFLTLAALIVF